MPSCLCVPLFDAHLELINPEIIDQSGSQTGLEGCLSVPGHGVLCIQPALCKKTRSL